MKYVVTKRCHANEFIMVEAESIEEAFDKAENYGGKQLSNYLEFNGYQDKSTWSIEELPQREDVMDVIQGEHK